MFTPYSVQCFTQQTGLPTGKSPYWNRIHYVVKVLVACSAYYRWVQDLYSACNSIISKASGYWLRTKSYCSLVTHPSPSESFACQLRTGWDSSLTCYPPHHQPLRAVWWEYPAVQMAASDLETDSDRILTYLSKNPGTAMFVLAKHLNIPLRSVNDCVSDFIKAGKVRAQQRQDKNGCLVTILFAGNW
jgi:hypothetical protein